MTRIIWLDANIMSNENSAYKDQLQKEFKSIDFAYATTIE